MCCYQGAVPTYKNSPLLFKRHTFREFEFLKEKCIYNEKCGTVRK